SDNMSIVVSTPPAITADPSTDTKCEGLEAQFSITATGSGTLTYQWQENGVNITGMGTQSVYSNYNTETLDISDVTGLNSNQYRCVVSGLCPVPASSENALLTVIDYPTITGTTPGSRCGEGTVNLVATASAGDIKWYEEVSGGDLLYTGNNWTTPSLTVSRTYYVGADNNGCISTSRTSITATINANTNITYHPSDATAKLGGSTSFSITSQGEGLSYKWQLFNGTDWDDLSNGGFNPNYAGVTTNLLQINQLTEPMSGSQYRCIVSSLCSGDLTSNPAILTVTLTATSGLWIGGTAGPPSTNLYNWDIGSNWDDGNVPNSATPVTISGSAIYQPIIYSGNTGSCANITILSRASLTVEGTLSAGGNLIIKSDATGTGGLTNTNTATINIGGTATVERYMSNNGYHYISTPINNAAYSQINDDVLLKNLTGGHFNPDNLPTAAKMPNIWILDEAHTHDIQFDQNAWKAPNGLDDVIGEMQGVALVVPTSGITLDIEGSGANLNKGNKLYTLTKTALSTDTDHNNIKIDVYGKTDENGIDYGDGPGNGWHIVGNPYPSPVDWDAVEAGGGIGANISHTITFFKATSLYFGSYGYYNPTLGPSGSFFPSNYIPSMQAFYLHNTRSTPGSNNLSFSNNFRSVSNEALGSPFYKKKSAKTPPVDLTLLRFNVINKETEMDGFMEETVIGFTKEANTGYDINYDAQKLFNTDENIPNLYSRIDKMNLAVNILPKISEDLVIPLCFKAQKPGKYILNLATIQNLPKGTKVYLNDMKLNTVQELTTDKEYSFTYELTDQTSRFYLSFTMTTNTISEISREMFYTYSNNKYLYINFNSEKGNTGLLEVFNAEGQKIIDGETISSGTFKFAIDEAKGIYIVRLITNKKVYTNRVFIE
ncbi:MAG: T9SS type A sorting domain-containing protein, partial [Bacteroidales bacterium]|nr:T9SS type A sorting domain-containing protein [Bacteroidales bacterium]